MKKLRKKCGLSLLCLLTLILGAPTWPRDDTGVPAPVGVFIGSSGVPTQTSATDRFPVETGAPTSSTTDPFGWGKAWFTSSVGNLVTTAIVFVNDQTVYAFDTSGGSPRTWVSANAGRSFILQDTSANLSMVQMNAAVRVGTSAFLIGANDQTFNDAAFARSVTGFQFAKVTLPTPCQPGNGVGCNVNSIGSQGTTVLIGISKGVTGVLCRSTTSGASFASCTTGLGNLASLLAIASPALNTWVVADANGTVARSTDDGVTFTNVLSMGGTSGNVACLSSTICLATNSSGSIWRSTDAGATWAVAVTITPNPVFKGFVNFGNGIVNAMGTGSPAAVFRSIDFGVSWAFQTNLPASPGSGGYTSTAAFNGRGIAGGNFASTDGVSYSPIVGAGQTLIAGQNGNQWNIDISGRGKTATNIQDSTFTNTMFVTSGSRAMTFNLTGPSNNGKICSEPAANTAASVSLTGVANQVIYLWDYIAFYTTAPAAAQILTVTSGASNFWLDIVGGANVPTRQSFSQGLLAASGATMTVTLPAGGATIVGKLCVTMSQHTQ